MLGKSRHAWRRRRADWRPSHSLKHVSWRIRPGPWGGPGNSPGPGAGSIAYVRCVRTEVRTYVRKSATNSAGGAVRLSCTFCGCKLCEIVVRNTSLDCLSVRTFRVSKPHPSVHIHTGPKLLQRLRLAVIMVAVLVLRQLTSIHDAPDNCVYRFFPFWIPGILHSINDS